jgi:hypothetical protein
MLLCCMTCVKLVEPPCPKGLADSELLNLSQMAPGHCVQVRKCCRCSISRIT